MPEREAGRNVEVLWLLKKLRPDFKTIADFRRDNPEAIRRVCREFTLLCKKPELFGGELVAIDGSKFRAVKSRRRNFNPAKPARIVKSTAERIVAHLTEMEQQDAAEPSAAKTSAEELRAKISQLTERQQFHEDLAEELTAGPWKPKNISVVSLGGERFYTALYEQAGAVGFEARSFLTAAEYQQKFDENKQKGRQLAHLDAYEHEGQPRFSAIWNSAAQGAYKARHGLGGGAYQQEWKEALQGGLLTRVVTGYEEGNAIRYGAVWRK